MTSSSYQGIRLGYATEGSLFVLYGSSQTLPNLWLLAMSPAVRLYGPHWINSSDGWPSRAAHSVTKLFWNSSPTRWPICTRIWNVIHSLAT